MWSGETENTMNNTGVHRSKISVIYSKGSLVLLYYIVASGLGALVNIDGIIKSAKYQDTLTQNLVSLS